MEYKAEKGVSMNDSERHQGRIYRDEFAEAKPSRAVKLEEMPPDGKKKNQERGILVRGVLTQNKRHRSASFGEKADDRLTQKEDTVADGSHDEPESARRIP